VRVDRRPVGDGIAGSAVPAGVSTSAVSEAGDVSDEDLIRAEGVAVRASRRWSGDPLPVRGLSQIAQYAYKPMTQ
jgi:hypothetical protein